MEREKKKALLELVKECDDSEFLRQIAITSNAIADAIDVVERAKNIMGIQDKLSFK